MVGAALLAGSALPALANPSASPRAWLVAKEGHLAMLVGEFDAYFDSVVKPGFARAQVAAVETYQDPRQIHTATVQRSTPCASSTSTRGTGRLAPAFDELAAVIKADGMEVPVWLENWKLIPEYLMAATILDFASGDSYRPVDAALKQARVVYGVSWQLHQDALASKTATKLRELDLVDSFREHFCGASAAEREDYLVDKVARMRNGLRAARADPGLASLKTIEASISAAMVRWLDCIDRAEACRLDGLSLPTPPLRALGMAMENNRGNLTIVLGKRSQAWVPIIKNIMAANRRSFVLVGAMHLPDFRYGSDAIPGLIGLLRGEGYTVRPIHSAGEIKDFLADAGEK